MLKEIIYLLHNRQKKKIYFFIWFNVCKFSFGDVEYISNSSCIEWNFK